MHACVCVCMRVRLCVFVFKCVRVDVCVVFKMCLCGGGGVEGPTRSGNPSSGKSMHVSVSVSSLRVCGYSW